MQVRGSEGGGGGGGGERMEEKKGGKEGRRRERQLKKNEERRYKISRLKCFVLYRKKLLQHWKPCAVNLEALLIKYVFCFNVGV